MTTQAYMTLTTVAAWVFLALVAIGIAYGIYAVIMEEVDRRQEERVREYDINLFESKEEAVEAYRTERDLRMELVAKYHKLEDKYEDLMMKCSKHGVGIERENVERKSE